ncbi:MAG: serine/threonine-protein phosphatase [Akkermansiaceae bacterium]|nr:serine/threonine-protein phosphatase [Akkermansiaceae bacterium]MCP5551130.1 serine/threonine-protein phosphatase [Akkermansiaceae bacterium]
MNREIFSFQDRGDREEQQDGVLVLADPKRHVVLAALADGAGGHSGGKLASELVMKVFREAFFGHWHPLRNPERFLLETAEKCHREIGQLGDGEHFSPRSTLVALYIDRKRAYWIHSGDSRLYIFRDGHLCQRTTDHSVAQMLLTRGKILEDELGHHPDQGRLTQSLGGDIYELPERMVREIERNEEFLLCSDGLWEHFSEEEMARIHSYVREEKEDGARKVRNACLQRAESGADNLSLIVIGPDRDVGSNSFSRIVGLILFLFGLATGFLITILTNSK